MNSRAALFLVPLLLWPAVAAAPPSVCFDRAEMAAHLAAAFSETPRHAAISTEGRLVEVFVAADGTSFTITVGDGVVACPVLLGESWINLDVKSKKGDPL